MCGDWIFGIFFLVAGAFMFAFFYPLPTWIVLGDPPRQDRKRIIKINLLLGWTVIGWIAAIVLACSGPKRYHA